MSEQNYPARGKMSEDGKYYTHTDGSVHERVEYADDVHVCDDCSLVDLTGMVTEIGCARCEFPKKCQWKHVAGAYVPTDEEREACDMARAMIKLCPQSPLIEDAEHCVGCPYLKDKDCPARGYLAAHHQQDAWEVNP